MVLADDGAFAFGSESRRDIELGARPGILHDHCVRWGMPVMPHATAGKAVAMYFQVGPGQHATDAGAMQVT
jgi:hypothetical protein